MQIDLRQTKVKKMPGAINKDLKHDIKMLEAYELGRKERNKRGLLGREWCLSDESGFTGKTMSENIIKGIDKTLDNFKPRELYEVIGAPCSLGGCFFFYTRWTLYRTRCGGYACLLVRQGRPDGLDTLLGDSKDDLQQKSEWSSM